MLRKFISCIAFQIIASNYICTFQCNFNLLLSISNAKQIQKKTMPLEEHCGEVKMVIEMVAWSMKTKKMGIR